MCTHLNSGTADVFTPVLIAGASEQFCESMLGIVKMSAQLEHAKLQQQIVEETQKQQREQAAREARARVWAEMVAQHDKNKKKELENPPKKARKDPAVATDDDNDDDKEDLEEVLEKGKHKRATPLLYKQLPTMREYARDSMPIAT